MRAFSQTSSISRLPRTVLLCLAAIVASVSIAHPRTWYVAHDGTGDAPTIHAAMDSASAGDSVVVGPGEYVIVETISVKAHVVLCSELGPLETRIARVGTNDPNIGISVREQGTCDGFWAENFPTGAITVGLTGDGARVTNNIMRGGTGMRVSASCEIIGNLIGATVYMDDPQGVIFANNIVLDDLIGGFGSSEIVACNDFLGNDVDWLLDLGGGTNFSLDPQFCGVAGSENFFLQSTSPCAPGNHPAGENEVCSFLAPQIGPLPVACGSVPVKQKSWGEIKAMYRE